MQYIYFSPDLEYMYERLKYERHFLYKREPVSKSNLGLTNEVTWHQVHRFHKLPLELLNLTEFPFIFSPSFSRYIDLDDSHTKLIIRNSLNHEKVISKIPEELMSGKEEAITDVVRRFRWLSDDRLHIINKEGIERIVDIQDGYKEVQFNFIPLYDKTICTKQHYMHDPPSYLQSECLKTLKKRYQSYKSSYNMKLSLDKNYDMYEDIFSVDYRIDVCKGNFETDMSFSFLHWRLIE